MTRKRRQEPRSGEFRNAPFKALKGVPVPSRPAAPPAAPRPGRPGAPQEDAEELFRRAMSGARPLRPAGNASAAPREGGGAQPAPEPDEDRAQQELFLEAMARIGTANFGRGAATVGEPGEDEGRRSASSRMKQLKRGTLRIGQELDLHGYLRDEALKRLGHFIDSAAAKGLQAVLVITGKGYNSPEGPVLQGAVAGWLAGPGRERVAEFHSAPRDKGGSGAFVVFLKKTGT